MNPDENNNRTFCRTNTSSSTNLNLAPGDVIEKAFLYWAGSGSGDFNVLLNNANITPTRTFSFTNMTDTFRRNYFSAFADVTQLVKTTGNGNYTLSELDVNENIQLYCDNATNFAGWAIVIVYKNETLPLFQLNVYDGLQGVPNEINIMLNNLNVIDTNNARIGFVAWEGDRGLDIGEQLTVNDSIISNLPLNPANNAFNGTNSFTQSDTLYNMDLDVYDIGYSIRVGDRSARIKLKSGRDVVMINTVVTRLASLLPDATIQIDQTNINCDDRRIVINYTVSNSNATESIPAHTPIAFYANGQLIGQKQTVNVIPIGGNESGEITVAISDEIPYNFELTLAIDDNGSGIGIVAEADENNNTDSQIVNLIRKPELQPLPNLLVCNQGLLKGTFDFSSYADLVTTTASDEVSFHKNLADAESKSEPILNISDYAATANTEIFVRVENTNCYALTSFVLMVKNCPPTVYNYISANNDGKNDFFIITGLRDIFMDFKLSVFSRWGQLLWTGNNQSPDWEGDVLKGFSLSDGKVPDGTYFYTLELNDPDYPKALNGFLYFHQ